MIKKIKIILLLSLLLFFTSCKNINEKQYSDYNKKILPTLVKGEEISDENRKKVLEIFKINYKNKTIDKYLEETKKDDITENDVINLVFIQLIANYKADLVEAKRGFDDKVMDFEKFSETVKALDEGIITYLNLYGITYVPKGNLYNENKDNYELTTFLNEIKKDFDININ